MSLVLFIPLYVPGTISTGLDRLPPNAQVRGAWLPAALMLVGLPILLVTTLALATGTWAELYSLAVAAVLLVLAALRQLAAVRRPGGCTTRSSTRPPPAGCCCRR